MAGAVERMKKRLSSWRDLSPQACVPMLALLLLSSLAVWICGQRIVAMYSLQADFEITYIYKVCEQPLNNRCVTHYTIRLPDGSKNDFVPLGAAFDRVDMYEGSHIVKRHKGFAYEINGVPRRWPHMYEQFGLFLAGLVGLFAWWKGRGPGYMRLWLSGGDRS